MVTMVEVGIDAMKIVFYCGACEALCEAVPPPSLPNFFVKYFSCHEFCGPFDQNKRLRHLAQLALDAAAVAPARARKQKAVPLLVPPESPRHSNASLSLPRR